MESRESYRDFGPDSFPGFQTDLSVMLFGDLLNNRKTETGASSRLGMTLVDAVKAVKDPCLVSAWNTDAGIPYAQGIMVDPNDH